MQGLVLVINQTCLHFVSKCVKDSVNYSFVADVHLGRLVKWLRLLGFGVWYNNDATPATLVETALIEDSVLLSKWAGFAQQPALRFLQIESSNAVEQLQQVIAHFYLKNLIQPFTRCLICNGHLQTVSKAVVEPQLLPNIRAAFEKFWQCDTCKRLYWEGSHYEKMLQLVKQVQHFGD